MKIIQRTITIAVPDEDCRNQDEADQLMDGLMNEDDALDTHASVIVHGRTIVTNFDHPFPKDTRPIDEPSSEEFDKHLVEWYALIDKWESEAHGILKELGLIQ